MTVPGDDDDLDARAAEYVLGALTASAAAEVERAIGAGDVALRDAVAAWKRRLAPLTALAAEKEPPAWLWARIEAVLPPARTNPPAPAPRGLRWPAFAAAAGGWCVAGCLALCLAVVLLRPPPGPALVTMMVPGRDAPAWFVEADRNGGLRLVSVNGRPPSDPTRVTQLWALPPGATEPTSLGLIPSAGLLTVPPGTIEAREGTLMEITSEPPGGSPTGRPTGPILFIGKLHPPLRSLSGALNLAHVPVGTLHAVQVQRRRQHSSLGSPSPLS